MRLFFSRRIGLSDSGEAIPILAGTRLTGRQGAYSMGLLNIQQREKGVVPSTNFTAVRLRRDILANSDIGGVFLNKEEVGSRYNRVAGIDANFRFGFLTMNGYVAKTFSPETTVPGTGKDFTTRASGRLRGSRVAAAPDVTTASASGSTTRWGSSRGEVSTTPTSSWAADSVHARSRNGSARSGRTGRSTCSRGRTAAASNPGIRTSTCRSTSRTARSSRSASTPTSR